MAILLRSSLTVLIVGVLCIQCKTAQQTTQAENEFRAVYKEQVKLTYLRKLLGNAFNQSLAVREILASDHSGFTEPLLSREDDTLLDSLVAIDGNRLRLDSAQRAGRVAEGAEGKHVLSLVLQRVGSGWLDSLAEDRYRRQGRTSF
ncbi:MAG: hypothetical protein EOP50_09890 [Sphingobacteriales bacterium]|nr:MAG: hypothetical protein EOP50_09890 [Sphingobacteriales bacterium]